MLQILQPLGLVHPQTAIFLPPAVVRLLGHLKLLADLRDLQPPCRSISASLSFEMICSVACRFSAMIHALSAMRPCRIHSHSTWTRFRRQGHFAALLFGPLIDQNAPNNSPVTTLAIFTTLDVLLPTSGPQPEHRVKCEFFNGLLGPQQSAPFRRITLPYEGLCPIFRSVFHRVCPAGNGVTPTLLTSECSGSRLRSDF